jgi:hypothetical protein
MTRDNKKPEEGHPALSRPGSEDTTPKEKSPEHLQTVTLRHDGRIGYPLETGPAQALVVHCADSRFQSAFRQFLAEELGITRYFPIIIGGGIHAFGLQNLLPKNFKVIWQQIKFVIDVAKPKQIIIINHEDCLWYNHLKGYHPTIAPKHKGHLDLRTAAERIVRDFSGIQVRTFWAGIEGSEVVFSEV